MGGFSMFYDLAVLCVYWIPASGQPCYANQVAHFIFPKQGKETGPIAIGNKNCSLSKLFIPAVQ